jgi:hypothetical protein
MATQREEPVGDKGKRGHKKNRKGKWRRKGKRGWEEKRIDMHARKEA